MDIVRNERVECREDRSGRIRERRVVTYDLVDGSELVDEFRTLRAAKNRKRELETCEHDWQEQPGEPPVDVCSSCGAVRE
jgi:hypothetical protein